MVKETVALLMTGTILCAGSLELTIHWDHGTVTLQNVRTLNGSPKTPRRVEAVSGPASPWSWQVRSADGTVLRESRFSYPLEICSGDEQVGHMIADTGTDVIVVPDLDGAARVAIVKNESMETVQAGDIVRTRSAGTTVATFDIAGGSR